MPEILDLSPKHLELVQQILAQHVPGIEVRVFGSRVKKTSVKHSDLDLVLVSPNKIPETTMRKLKDAFELSPLPMRVDILEWQETRPAFRKIIAGQFLVIQGPTNR